MNGGLFQELGFCRNTVSYRFIGDENTDDGFGGGSADLIGSSEYFLAFFVSKFLVGGFGGMKFIELFGLFDKRVWRRSPKRLTRRKCHKGFRIKRSC